MELITLALLAATIAALHRMASLASGGTRTLLPELEDPLTIVLARLGFRSENHRVVAISRVASTILPHRFVGQVEGLQVTVDRDEDGIEIAIEHWLSWPNTHLVLSEVFNVDSRLGAALLGDGIAHHIVLGGTLSFDGRVLRLALPRSATHASQIPKAIRALVRAAARLTLGPAALDDWLLTVATADQSAYARRNAMTVLLADTDSEVVVARAIAEGRSDTDVGVRLAIADHIGDDIIDFLEVLAGSRSEPSIVRRDALEQLIHTAPVDRSRRTVTAALARDDQLRADALAVLTEMVAEDDGHAARILSVIDEHETLRLARPVLWAIIVVAGQRLAIEAIGRLAEVGTGADVQDLRRIDASPALLHAADDALARIHERVGVHSLSIVDASDLGKLSVVR